MNENSLTSQDYVDQLFKTVKIIIQSELEKAKFDQTITAKIIQQDEEDPTKYLVDTGSLKFYAYSDIEYKANLSVSVLIPQGDYNNERKLIIGANYKNEKSQQDLLSINRFEDLVIGRQLEFTNFINTEFKYSTNYDYLGIKTYLDSTGMESIPDFKIQLVFAKDGEAFFYADIFTKKDILGNKNILTPYIPNTVLLQFPQEINCQDIKEVAITLVSDEILPSTFLNKIELLFGYKKETVITEPLKLYGDNTYTEEIQKNIYVEYYDGKQLQTIYNNNIIPITILQYKNGEPATTNIEKIAGTYWKTIAENKKEINFITDLSYKNMRFKAIVQKENENIESSVLTFKNNNTSQSNAITNGETIILELSDSGVYNYYGMDGHIKNFEHSTKERIITATFVDGSDITIGKDGVVDIQWVYPNGSSGIATPAYWSTEFQDTKRKQTYIKDQALKDKNNNPITINQDEEGKFSNIFKYKLNQNYFPSYSNNTITCIVTIQIPNTNQKQILQNSFTFDFGNAGTNGTNYSLNINFADPERKFIQPGETIELIATFERIDGEPLSVIPEYNWSWYQLSENQNLDYWDNINNLSIPAIRNNENIDYASYVNESGEITSRYIKNNIWIKVPEDFLLNDQTDYCSVVTVMVEYLLESGNKEALKEYLPLPIVLEKEQLDNLYFSGPNRIVYDMANNYNFDNSPFSSNLNCNWRLNYKLEILEYINNKYQVYNINNPSNLYNNFKNINTHLLKMDYNNKVSLDVQPIMTFDNFSKIITLQAIYNNKVIYLSPIITLRNKWQNATINNWNSNETDVTNNHILTPFFAAGTKSNGLFTGVMLGKIEFDDKINYGLYGYNESINQFYLNEQGEFFVGNRNNFISFNNSLNINTENFSLNANNIKISSNGSLQLLNNNKTIFNFNTQANTAIIAGWNFDELKMWSNKIPGSNSGIASSSASDDPAFWAGCGRDNPWEYYAVDETDWRNDTKFYVTQKGKMRSKDAEIDGSVKITGILQAGTLSGSEDTPAFQVDYNGEVTFNSFVYFGEKTYSSSYRQFRINVEGSKIFNIEFLGPYGWKRMLSLEYESADSGVPENFKLFLGKERVYMATNI